MSHRRTCDAWREAISARADGEDPGLAPAEVDDHLEGCSSCRRFADRTTRLAGQLRLRPLPAVPDLTARIMAATHDAPPAPGPRRQPRLRGRRRSERPTPGRRARSPRAAVVAVTTAAAVTAAGAIAGALLGLHVAGRAPLVSTAQVEGSTQSNPRYPGALVLPRSVRKPDVVLTDTSGRPYDLAATTHDRLTLVYFGYTHCPDVCPVTMALAAQALAHLPGTEQREVAVVFVTTDPSRDTPRVIRAWLDNFSPAFAGLTGTPEQIRAAEEEIGMPLSYAEPGPSGGRQVVHAGYALVYARNGTAQLQVDSTDTPAALSTTLRHLLSYGYRDS